MSKYKVGDEVVLVDSRNNPSVLKNGVTGVVISNGENTTKVQFNVGESKQLHSGGGLGEKGKCWVVMNSEIELLKPKTSQSFKTSNRYKLHKYILSTGISKLDLSRALNKGDSFLSVETRESQFTNRGDMSDARYKSLRKQIKEVVQIKSTPVDISVIAGEINQTLAEVEPKAKECLHYDSSIGLTGRYSEGDYVIYDGEIIPARFAVALDIRSESIKEEAEKPKPSNSGVLILALVFFVMLVVFILGCFIYKAA